MIAIAALKTSVELQASTEGKITPAWDEVIPCRGESRCQFYDGKRCRLIGNRPRNGCEPAISTLFDFARSAP